MRILLTLCLLLVISISVAAQNNGPTKEQTIEYIKGYYSDFKVVGRHDGYHHKYSDNYKVTINDTKMIVEWDTYIAFSNKYDKHQAYEFDIKNIEYLSISENSGSDYCESGIIFNTVNKKLNIRYIDGIKESFVNHLDISIYRGTKCLEDASQTQIFKAFNHLRKLSGAPEPIKF